MEGEYITPIAARSIGHLPQDKKSKDGKEKKKRKHRKSEGSEAGSSLSKGSMRSSKLDVPKEKSLIKVKKPSPLRSMFQVEGYE